MAEEWGPWIEHDGKGCPVVGQYVAVICEAHPGNFIGPIECIAGSKGGESWDWKLWLTPCSEGSLIGRVIRYRVRKPRALLNLIEMVERMPNRVDA